MLDQINEVRNQGLKPAIFIEDSLKRILRDNEEISRIIKKALEINIPVYGDNDTLTMEKTFNLHIFKYGHVSSLTVNRIVKKGGKVVSGNLRV